MTESRRELMRIATALERIATALERFEPVTAADEGPPPCPHPPEQRFALGAGEHGWVCGVCGEPVEKGTTT